MRHAHMVAHRSLTVRSEVPAGWEGFEAAPDSGSYHRAMPVRDLPTLERVQAQPFAGYAIRPRWAFAPDVDRVVACVALLVTMVISGIVLGSPRR